VLLALTESRDTEGVAKMIERGRAFLAASQKPDGSWPATTRPRGGESYAQQMSTTAWATLALLHSR
jgi:squalene cyclase